MSKQTQLINMLGPKKNLSHAKGEFTKAFYKSVINLFFYKIFH
jgi:uncharacterized protein (UPF0332 family)